MCKSKREGGGEWFGSVWGYVDGVEERLGHLLRLLILVILNHKTPPPSDPPVSVSRDQSKVGEKRSAAHYCVLLLPCGLLAAAHGQVCPCALDVTLPTPRQHRVPSAHDNRERVESGWRGGLRRKSVSGVQMRASRQAREQLVDKDQQQHQQEHLQQEEDQKQEEQEQAEEGQGGGACLGLRFGCMFFSCGTSRPAPPTQPHTHQPPEIL